MISVLEYWLQRQQRSATAKRIISAHRVTHRESGVIPNCTPCPRSGTFRPDSWELATHINHSRAYDYANNVRMYLGEEIELEAIYRAWSKPLYGAFGEEIR